MNHYFIKFVFNTNKFNFIPLISKKDILRKYWGFSSFREKQEDIIDAVLKKQDTLALLPTGGGKSLCYQVPGMILEGVCLVISPLIALMEDQVKALKSKGIKAVAINSSMSKREIDIQLDNAIYGETKFLYVSPERLQNHLFKVRLEKMKVNLIAIDEAHCISQWGYDFRPPYLEIAALRILKPNVPFLALTATATSEVVEDIQEKLGFKSSNVIQKSFERKNLVYSTYLTNNKKNSLEIFLKKHAGCGIIYCSTRRGVKELSVHLIQKGFSVEYYHGGLGFEERRLKQEKWTSNKARIMIATNAFGMGIDKPDVRFVLHYDIPESLEAYYQEAGRAGRDGETAIAHLYYEAEDVHKLTEKIALKYPPIEQIKKIYNALGNHLQLATGSGKDEAFPINIQAFSEKYNQSILIVYNALKFLELCGYIRLSENYNQASKIKILGNNFDIYQYQTKDKEINSIIQFILRSEMGVFENYAVISENRIHKKTAISIPKIKEKLRYLHSAGVIDYIESSSLPTITYTTERLQDNYLHISPKFYFDRKENAKKKLDAVIDFIRSSTCKSELLLHYFNENNTIPCGACSSCIQNTANTDKSLMLALKRLLHTVLSKQETIAITDILVQFDKHEEVAVLDALARLAEHQHFYLDPTNKQISRF